MSGKRPGMTAERTSKVTDHVPATGAIRPMRRRDLIAGLAAIGLTFARPGYGQQPQPQPLRRVGGLIALPESDPLGRELVASFSKALAGLGWAEGRNILIDYRFAAADPTLFEAYAKELVGLAPDAILAATPPAVMALRRQTSTIPIVFLLVVDPVGLGLVQSLARPGGNITGFSVYDAPIVGKWLQLLKEIAPGVTRVGVIFHPETAPYAPLYNGVIETAAPSFGMSVTLAPLHDASGIEGAVAALAREPGGGLIVLPDIFNATHRDALIASATRHGVPLMGFGSLFPRAGALMSYWSDPVDMFAQAASYIDRILKGAKPAELPVQEPTKFELIINLKTAQALGLTVPQSLLARADEVIE
jgi:putative ABC transport system substrate-binding protein